MKWQALVRRGLRALGYDIVQVQWSGVARRIRLMERYQIDLVLDIGANQGQYATQLRENGYRAAIVSFEPLNDAFAVLQTRAKADAKWQAVQLALGVTDDDTVIHVSSGNVNSSLLPLTEHFPTFNPTARVTHDQKTRVRRLDSIAPQYIPPGAKVFSKLDTQGYEALVLRGATETLKRICGVQMEMSITPLYQGETDMLGLLYRMQDLGFTLMSTENVYSEARTGRQYQLDGIFFHEPMP
jgi:FkbM family methyltransferase